MGKNLSQVESIIKKKLSTYDKLKTLLQNHNGYIGKLTEFLMNNSVNYNELEKLMGIFQLYRNLNQLTSETYTHVLNFQ